MTFLDLCKTLRAECSMSGIGPTTTLNQSGQMLQCVTWINRAYREIINEHPDWLFLVKELTFNTFPSVQVYKVDSVNAADLENWILSSLRVSKTNTNEIILNPVVWDVFRDTFKLGSNRSTTGMPVYVTTNPANSLEFYPTPDAQYAINGEYLRRPVDLINDTDTPILPISYHLLLVYKAMMYYGIEYAANEKYIYGENQYRKLKFQMERKWRNHSRLPSALA